MKINRIKITVAAIIITTIIIIQSCAAPAMPAEMYRFRKETATKGLLDVLDMYY
jgi:hypothetical protein